MALNHSTGDKSQMSRTGAAGAVLRILVTLGFASGFATSHADVAGFVPEAINQIESLPDQYPDHWVMIHDASFFHMSEGEIIVADPLGATLGDQYKGMMTASLIADYARSKRRNEHYVMETFYSRGGRGGERTDTVTIYDSANLAVQAEIIIPPKRVSGMPKPLASGMIDNDRFLLIYNFTPSQSVSVVDLESRQFVGEVPTAGCGFVIPTAKRGFTSICANGSLYTTHLNANGKAEDSHRTEPMFDAENNPVFEAAAITGGVAYFPTFHGQILPLDVSGKRVTAKNTWWLTDTSERGWRPGGLKPVATDDQGTGYFLMHPDGKEGSHKDGGSEVWVYDLKKQRRTARIPLKNWSISISTTGTGERRMLTATNTDMQVDVYQLPAGQHLHALAVATATPFIVHGAQ